MARINKLWRAAGGPGMPPAVSKRRVKARVNAALDAAQQERSSYMKRRLCTAMAAIAILIAITGTAFAAAANWSTLSVWFTGDTSPGQQYLDSEVRSVSDENYTLTVESAAGDESSAYMVVCITALNDEAKSFLHNEKFISMDTLDVWFLTDFAGSEDSGGFESGFSISTRELDAPAENQRRFALSVYSMPDSTEILYVRCGYMDADASVEVPIAPAPSVTVKIGASGAGVLEAHPVPAGDSRILTIEEITFSPFTCYIQTDCSSRDIYPRILLRMADGAIRTQSQMLSPTGASFHWDENQAEYCYRFNEIQDLDNIVSVIVFDMEYPLDGAEPASVGHDMVLDPFQVRRMDRLEGGSGFSIPAQDLTEGLGGSCEWDAAREEMTCTYRGITVVLQPGNLTALVNGEPVELPQAPAMQDGVLAAPYQIFTDSWGIACYVLRESVRNGEETEIIWGDWYIVP